MLTLEMRNKLVDAIKNANGTQKYVNKDGTPRCVVGLLAASEGVSITALRTWDSTNDNSCAIGVLNYKDDLAKQENRPGIPELEKLAAYRHVKIPTDQQAAWLEAFPTKLANGGISANLLPIIQDIWDKDGNDVVRHTLIELVEQLPVTEPG